MSSDSIHDEYIPESSNSDGFGTPPPERYTSSSQEEKSSDSPSDSPIRMRWEEVVRGDHLITSFEDVVQNLITALVFWAADELSAGSKDSIDQVRRGIKIMLEEGPLEGERCRALKLEYNKICKALGDALKTIKSSIDDREDFLRLVQPLMKSLRELVFEATDLDLGAYDDMLSKGSLETQGDMVAFKIVWLLSRANPTKPDSVDHTDANTMCIIGTFNRIGIPFQHELFNHTTPQHKKKWLQDFESNGGSLPAVSFDLPNWLHGASLTGEFLIDEIKKRFPENFT